MIIKDENGELADVEYQAMGMYQANRIGYEEPGNAYGIGMSPEDAVNDLIFMEETKDREFINGEYVYF